MSKLQVDTIVNSVGTGLPDFPNGIGVTSIGTVSDTITIPGNLNTAGDAEFTGVCTATSFSGDGSGLSGVNSPPIATGIASGSIASGAAVALADDGKFMTVTGSNSSFGAQGAVDSDEIGSQMGSIAYDTANNKIVVVYRTASTDKGYAVVGNVSGTTITWGSKVQFSTTTCAYPNVCFDSNAERVVITMRDEGGRGDAVVGTVSGTSISFGSVTNFESSTNVWRHACAFDSTTNKVVIGYIDNPSSWSIRAIVGTVSGTSISFGTAVTGGAAGSGDTPRMVCDNGVATITYNTKVVGATISGTDITFGTPQTQTWVDGNTLCSYVPIAHDPMSGKYLLTGYKDDSADSPFVRSMTRSGTVYTINDDVIVWGGSGENNTVAWAGQKDTFIVANNKGTDGADGSYTTVITTPGTSTVVGSPHMFTADKLSSEKASLHSVYDPDSKAVVLYYRNNDQSNKGYYYVQKLRISNGTLGGYVGLSNAAYTNGQTAKVAVTGAVSTNQTGLTTATRYYLAGDGTLSPTTDTEGLIVGQALSATTLLLR